EELTERIEVLEASANLRAVLPSGLGNALIKSFGLKPSKLIGELKELLEERIMEGLIESDQTASYYVEHLREDLPQVLVN
ncbi:hypothetical protein Q6294_33610, partial [Klebsiella pneumoniae]